MKPWTLFDSRIRGVTWNIFKHDEINRVESVRRRYSLSDLLTVTRSVCQGTMLNHILFVLHTNNIGRSWNDVYRQAEENYQINFQVVKQ